MFVIYTVRVDEKIFRRRSQSVKGKFKRLVSVFMTMLILLGSVVTNFGAMPVFAVGTIEYYEGYTDKTQYENFNAAFYVRKKGSNAKGEMVFCFNETKHEPNTLKEGATDYTKAEGSAENFTHYATTPRVQNNELKEKVLAIIYNAYHNSKFNKMGLSDGYLRKAVQCAIWHYTDNSSRTNALIEAHYAKPQNATEKKLYEELIKGAPKAPSNFELDLYISEDSSKQHLLGTRITDWEKEIKLIKEDAVDHQWLDGAVFKFVSGDGYVGDTEKEYTSSAKNPTIKIAAGIWRVTEKTLPERYLLDDARKTEGVVIKVDDEGNLYKRSFKGTDVV